MIDLVGLEAVQNAIDEMDKVFGIFYDVPLTEEQAKQARNEAEVPQSVLYLVTQRSIAKEAKDWQLADSLRQRIAELGFAVKDVKDGEPIVTRVEA